MQPTDSYLPMVAGQAMFDPNAMSDETLIERIVGQRFQDESAFAELIQRYQGRVYSTCLRMMEDVCNSPRT